ncbi:MULTISPECIES: guanitoxin biosynthesis MATE family efflux transporter GntT [Kamptonema]|uniref:guanitoxin biosynthesis MATE family efflux transporter GntT n=1 Tax=Kamptonema TaxID=1501433 RepID=UPI0001DAC371|nr:MULTISPECIES: guanitoxin biosynthesis MATE family efflux transporter GntT [Kamptonema]AMO66168.1 AnaI [Kamptonema sp. PCC 6506]CBN53698.1 Putative Multidrug exporter MatE [Kamptonema sp. PCC 6506]
MNLILPAQYNFIPRYFRLALANVLSSIMVPLANIASVMFLGHLEEIRHFAGVNLAGNLLNFVYLVLFFLRMGTTGVTAQAVGRNDREGMLLVGLRNGVIALVLGVVLILLQYPLGELGFALLNVPPEIKSSGLAYLYTQIWGAPAILLNFVLIGWFLGREKNGLVVFLSILGNGGKIALDYLLIIYLGWESVGAGVSYATSQYLALLVGLIFFFKEFQWLEIRTLFGKIWDISAMKSNLTLNTNILLSNLIILIVSLTFSYQGVQMGTVIYSQNALLWQIFSLNIYFVEGLGFGTETLVGNFKGKGDSQQLAPIAFVSLSTALMVGLFFGGVCVLFPDFVFSLFTNHTEVTSNIKVFLPWLQLSLLLCAIGFTLEGYFLGLAQGDILRNVSLVAFVVGFVPTSFAFIRFPSNHLLWFSLSLFYAIRMVMYIINLFRTFGSDVNDGVGTLPTLEENRDLEVDLSKNL